MEDKGLIFWGTFGLFTFNLLLVIFACVAFKSLSLLWAIILIAPFTAGAIYFDILVGKYFVNKIKEKRSKKNHE